MICLFEQYGYKRTGFYDQLNEVQFARLEQVIVFIRFLRVADRWSEDRR